MKEANPIATEDRGVSTAIIVIGILAIIHAVAGLLRSVQWFGMGSDLMGKGLLLVPLLGVLTIARGVFTTTLALLFLVFACGLFLQRSWTRWLGIALAATNLLLVLSLLLQGESLARALPWAVVPAIILIYLPADRRDSSSKKVESR
jgi:hypothetical protein